MIDYTFARYMQYIYLSYISIYIGEYVNWDVHRTSLVLKRKREKQDEINTEKLVCNSSINGNKMDCTTYEWVGVLFLLVCLA